MAALEILGAIASILDLVLHLCRQKYAARRVPRRRRRRPDNAAPRPPARASWNSKNRAGDVLAAQETTCCRRQSRHSMNRRRRCCQTSQWKIRRLYRSRYPACQWWLRRCPRSCWANPCGISSAATYCGPLSNSSTTAGASFWSPKKSSWRRSRARRLELAGSPAHDTTPQLTISSSFASTPQTLFVHGDLASDANTSLLSSAHQIE